jgi:hypothetical protein
MFKIKTGDLLKAPETYLCHQCNCVTRRSKHLAKAVFASFPYADIYSKREKPSQPGTIVIKGDGKDRRYVINMLGQFYPGCKYPNSKKDGRDIRFKHFKSCLFKMKNLKGSFAFPWKIGCGAAGGNWGIYLQALKNFEKEIGGDVVIYKLEVSKPKSKHPTLF